MLPDEIVSQVLAQLPDAFFYKLVLTDLNHDHINLKHIQSSSGVNIISRPSTGTMATFLHDYHLPFYQKFILSLHHRKHLQSLFDSLQSKSSSLTVSVTAQILNYFIATPYIHKNISIPLIHKGLRIVNLSGAKNIVSDQLLSELLSICINLTVLNLSNCASKTLTDKSIFDVVRRCVKLERFIFCQFLIPRSDVVVTGDGIRELLLELARLRFIDLSFSGFKISRDFKLEVMKRRGDRRISIKTTGPAYVLVQSTDGKDETLNS